MNKDHVRSTMLSLTEGALKHAKQGYADFLNSARIDRGGPVEAGDASMAEQASDLAEAFDQPIHTNIEKLDKLESINFGPKDEVGEGAVVKFNGRHFVIAVPTSKFVCEGESFMGISTDAPIYQSMKGLTAGEEFSFGDRKYQIELLF
jgi:hypothetical protein